MNAAHLITAARDALAIRYPHERTVSTLTITTTRDPASQTLTYDAENVAVRHDDGSLACIDLTGTEFAEDLVAHAEDRLVYAGALSPLTLRLGLGPATQLPAELDTRTRLFILSIHARAAAHRPGLTVNQVLELTNLAYDANDIARHDSTDSSQLEPFARRAAVRELPFPREATAHFLVQTARLAVRTMSHNMQPCPLAVELPAGHFGNTPGWLAHQAAIRFRNGATRPEPRYDTPALKAVLHHLAALQTPTAGDRLSLYLTDPPASTTGRALDRDPIPEGAAVHDAMPGAVITGEQVRRIADLLEADEYVVQLRHGGTWHLPHHDEPGTLSRRQVAATLRRARDRSTPGAIRFSRDTDGTVYVSDTAQAARYLPSTLIPDHRDGHCPGCQVPYATIGEGPCDMAA
ncbi:hypothetical protein [Streptomyces parvus]|uniref:hypothetical protein n=1 Tax=Streptomyces parvus TaxID=66428 RepID=UPI002100FC5D|nr:hypothetical protein [Streptomyces parvus]MCQ1577233.1 hypothetical protein [Streptomyces parvus]